MDVDPKRLPKCVVTAHVEGKPVVAVHGPHFDAFGGLDETSKKRLRALVRERLARLKPGAVLVPVRQGFPLLVAEVAVKLGVPLVLLDLVLTKQGKVERAGTNLNRWAPENRKLLKKLVNRANATVKYRGNSYEYNGYLADASTVLFCAHDASFEDRMLDHLVAYSDQMGRQIENLFPVWRALEQRLRRQDQAPIRLVSKDAQLPREAVVVEIDSGALARPSQVKGEREYEEFLRKQLADKASEFRRTLLNAWKAASSGRQVCLVTADPESADHGRVLVGFLQRHLAPQSS